MNSSQADSVRSLQILDSEIGREAGSRIQKRFSRLTAEEVDKNVSAGRRLSKKLTKLVTFGLPKKSTDNISKLLAKKRGEVEDPDDDKITRRESSILNDEELWRVTDSELEVQSEESGSEEGFHPDGTVKAPAPTLQKQISNRKDPGKKLVPRFSTYKSLNIINKTTAPVSDAIKKHATTSKLTQYMEEQIALYLLSASPLIVYTP